MQPSDHLSRCVLGTAGLGGVWGKVDRNESVRTILASLENGITSIDTAPAYGDAEEFVGMALGLWGEAMPAISTKVGRLKTYQADHAIYDYTGNAMQESVVNSLRTLDVPAIDLLFLHDPLAIPEAGLESVLEQMLKLKEKGYAKKLGIGGNGYALFKQYEIGETFDVAMEFNRLDACCQDALDSSFPFYQSQGVNFYAASPLHMGLLGNRFEAYSTAPPVWMDHASIAVAKQVKIIADKYHISLPSLARRFLLSVQKDFKVVIGATDTRQLQETIGDVNRGPLPDNIFLEIMSLKDKKNER